MTIKEKQENKKEELMNEVKNSEAYINVLKKFPDAELVDVKSKKGEE